MLPGGHSIQLRTIEPGPVVVGERQALTRSQGDVRRRAAVHPLPLSRRQANAGLWYPPIAGSGLSVRGRLRAGSVGLRREPGFQARRQQVKEDAQLKRHRLPFRVEDVNAGPDGQPQIVYDAKFGAFVIDPGFFTRLVYEGV